MIKHVLGSLITISLLMGCYRTHLEQEAKTIIISRDAPPCCCKFVRDLVAHEGILFNAYLAPVRQLEIGAMNHLRNQAYELDANYVYLLTPRPNYINLLNASWFTLPGKHDITYFGQAYRCPPPEFVED
jgi:hypothetical protein